MSQKKEIGGLSPNEVKALAFLRQYIGKHAYAPSYDEMLAALDIKSKSGIARVLDQLEEGGLIARVEGKMRAIKITPAGMAVKLPEGASN